MYCHTVGCLQNLPPCVLATESPGDLHCLVHNPQASLCTLSPPPTACSAIVIDGIILAVPTPHTHCPPSSFSLLFAGPGPDLWVFIKASSCCIIVCSQALSSPCFLTMGGGGLFNSRSPAPNFLHVLFTMFYKHLSGRSSESTRADLPQRGLRSHSCLIPKKQPKERRTLCHGPVPEKMFWSLESATGVLSQN